MLESRVDVSVQDGHDNLQEPSIKEYKNLHKLYPKLCSSSLYQILRYHICCSGWSYSAWQGPFYSLNLENSRWLSYYSQVFDFVEIDSSFYRIPTTFIVKNWCKKTPDHFRFTAKFPRVITHDKRLKDVEKEQELIISKGVVIISIY